MADRSDHTNEDALASIARQIINSNRYMTLATADEAGTPRVYAVLDYREFVWVSSPGATHSTNLSARPQVSVVIFDSGTPIGTGQAVHMTAAPRSCLTSSSTGASSCFPGDRRHTAAPNGREPMCNHPPATGSTGPLGQATARALQGRCPAAMRCSFRQESRSGTFRCLRSRVSTAALCLRAVSGIGCWVSCPR